MTAPGVKAVIIMMNPGGFPNAFTTAPDCARTNARTNAIPWTQVFALIPLPWQRP